MPVTPEILRDGFVRIAAALEAEADALNAADARLGDGDLGVTLVRGSRAVVDGLNPPPGDVGATLAKAAQTFTRLSGSSFGTILSVGLLEASKPCRGRSEIGWNEIPDLLQAALSAMMQRGKASLGDKTVLDAIEAARTALAGVEEPARMQPAAERAVAEALEAFRTRPNRIGRARMFADRSIGQDDPGMLAFSVMVRALGR